MLSDMVSRGFGRIVVNSSVAGLKGYAYVTAYCAAKHAAVGFVRALAQETVKSGVTVKVLISYGEHWFPWYVRRLAERPANVWFVVRNMWG